MGAATLPPVLLMTGHEAYKKLVSDYQFLTVLDIGCGKGVHAYAFRKDSKIVTAIDIALPDYFLEGIKGNYLTTGFNKHDLAWCCHALEHQLNVNTFLRKVSDDTKDGGIIAITVPPSKSEIVGGHYSIWNAGLLIYNLVMAGIDCSKVQIKSYGYNISVIVRNNKIKLPDNLPHDFGELEMLKDYLPPCINLNQSGEICNYNWEGII